MTTKVSSETGYLVLRAQGVTVSSQTGYLVVREEGVVVSDQAAFILLLPGAAPAAGPTSQPLLGTF